MKERTKEQTGARRGEWLFSYPVKDVLESARARLTHHKERLQWWEAEREKAKEEVKAAGFKVLEYEVTGGKDVQVQVDPAPVQRLNQCNQKIREHQPKVKEFRQWVAVLETQRLEEHIDLSMDDALYFGVARNESEA